MKMLKIAIVEPNRAKPNQTRVGISYPGPQSQSHIRTKCSIPFLDAIPSKYDKNASLSHHHVPHFVVVRREREKKGNTSPAQSW